MANVWRQFIEKRDHERPKSLATGVRCLQTDDLDFIEFLKTDRPSLTSGELLREVNEHCQIPGGVSTVTINRAVRTSMHEGKWSRKVMTRPAAEKFTDNNIAYCQAFIDYISTVDPYRLKFFDETGLKLPVKFVALARALNFLLCGKIIINLGLSVPLLCCALCTHQRKHTQKIKVCISKQQYSSDFNMAFERQAKLYC